MCNNKKHVYFIGIGGVGMTPLAMYYRELGYNVSGSDIAVFRMLNELQQKGIVVNRSQIESNINASIDEVVYSTAILGTNQELMKAKKLGIDCIDRISAIRKIVQSKKLISISGSYGKSTTTVYASSMFSTANCKPSWLIGADMLHYPCFKISDGEYFILETDESKPEYLQFSPEGLIVTNFGNDHLPNYGNKKINLINSLVNLMMKTKESVVIPYEMIKNYKELFNGIKYTTCGVENCDYQIQDLKTEFNGVNLFTKFHVKGKYSEFDSQIKMPSLRNVLDAVFAFALLESFAGQLKNPSQYFTNLPVIDRRFQFYPSKHKALIVDDEGDSPEVIKAVLADAKKYFPNKKLVVLLQPHRYSRLKNLFAEYIECVHKADELIILPVYSAGESDRKGVKSRVFFDSVNLSDGNKYLAKSLDHGVSIAKRFLDSDSIILALGPGDVWKACKELVIDEHWI
ncbi:MAG: hypothetical protein KAH01_00545 [Caldisericia bacterium]|nr:hypothetical protein [Caldisericia bacterium]